jgi:curved DNA-binding protein CbpA
MFGRRIDLVTMPLLWLAYVLSSGGPHSTLGLARHPAPTDADVKRAFKDASLQHHPDKGGDKDAFYVVKAAYETLKSERARLRHDHLGEDQGGFYAGGVLGRAAERGGCVKEVGEEKKKVEQENNNWNFGTLVLMRAHGL